MGAINTWGRTPYATSVRDMKAPPTNVPATNTVHHNLLVTNYGADAGCVDNVSDPRV